MHPFLFVMICQGILRLLAR